MRCVPWQVALPVGQEIKYKYVVHSGDQWRWEPGFDRSLPTEGNVRPLVELRDFHRTSGLLSPCSSLLLLAPPCCVPTARLHFSGFLSSAPDAYLPCSCVHVLKGERSVEERT